MLKYKLLWSSTHKKIVWIDKKIINISTKVISRTQKAKFIGSNIKLVKNWHEAKIFHIKQIIPDALRCSLIILKKKKKKQTFEEKMC